jgi:hypothetical protein
VEVDWGRRLGWINGSKAAVSIDTARRVVYVVNLKSGCTSLQKLLRFGVPEGAVVEVCGAAPLRESRLVKSVVNCGVPLNSSSKHHLRIQSTMLSDETLRQYFVMSFSRDPSTRVVSSYQQALTGGGFIGLDQVLVGKGSNVATNVHFRSQVHQLASVSASGRRLPLDFVGRLESLDEDWARLQPALDASHLNPRERRALILPRSSSRSPRPEQRPLFSDAKAPHAPTRPLPALVHQRPGGTSLDPNFLPGPRGLPDLAAPWTLLRALLVCRRYLQDFVCLDYDHKIGWAFWRALSGTSDWRKFFRFHSLHNVDFLARRSPFLAQTPIVSFVDEISQAGRNRNGRPERSFYCFPIG